MDPKDRGGLLQCGGATGNAGCSDDEEARTDLAYGYFFSCGVSASFMPERKLRMPSPRPLPRSARRPGPKTSSAMMRMTTRSIGLRMLRNSIYFSGAMPCAMCIFILTHFRCRQSGRLAARRVADVRKDPPYLDRLMYLQLTS